MTITTLYILISFIVSSVLAQKNENNRSIIANGQMPDIATDKYQNVHIVYGSGDSIMYLTSNDGQSFSRPFLVSVLPKLFASAMRGPQIAVAVNGLVITACTKDGNIFSYKQGISGKWTKVKRLNDVKETAKEVLMDLSADGLHLNAVWLGLSQKGQAIYGARSIDGGKTWSANKSVYASPDSTVCECCKPSVAVKGNSVFVMFRNWINGNRDLYLIKSGNGGSSFGRAQKLGYGSWKLNGCPMDGGGLVIRKSGNPETVWRRESKIYAAAPGMPEKEIGEGRSCSMKTINNNNIYTWTTNGNIIILKPGGEKINLGKGSLPLLKALNKEQAICVWEYEKRIYSSVFQLKPES